MLWISLALAIAVHLWLTRISVFESEKEPVKPLTTEFVKREPRLTKPLELKKKPRPKRQPMKRKMVPIKLKVGSKKIAQAFHPARISKALAKPEVGITRLVPFEAEEREPKALSQAVEGEKTSKHGISMALELLDVQALDTGKYHALVIQDPEDKRSVRGFFHIALVYSVNQPRVGSDVCEWSATPYLAEAINRYTDIRADVMGLLSLDEREIFKVPIVFMTTRDIGLQLSRSEATNFGKYLLAGGFAFFEDNNAWLGSSADVALRKALSEALATQDRLEERDWTFEKLPHRHSIYHCYFDLDGPPSGRDAYGVGGYGGRPFPWLDGITLDDRLLAIMSNKGYMAICGHAGRGQWANDVQAGAWARIFQMGVNIVVYALTQEGSITNQILGSVQ